MVHKLYTVNDKTYARENFHDLGIRLAHNVGKTFVVLLNKNKNNLKFCTYEICKKNFRGLLKICENRESFLPHKFYRLRYL